MHLTGKRWPNYQYKVCTLYCLYKERQSKGQQKKDGPIHSLKSGPKRCLTRHEVLLYDFIKYEKYNYNIKVDLVLLYIL